MQDGTFINVHQMYGWKKATALGERFVAKIILEERDPTKIFKLLKALARRNVPQSTKDLVYVVPPQSWGDQSDTKHSKCLLLGGRRLIN